MKKNKSLSLLIILTLIWSTFSFAVPVDAASSATVGFSGKTEVEVGTEVSFNLNVSNVVDTVGGVVSIGGYVVFDKDYFEYVSASSDGAPYSVSINTKNNYKIGGVDNDMTHGITGNGPTKVMTFKFKALKEGETELTMSDLRISDMDKKFPANLVPLKVKIVPKKSTPTPSNPSTPTPPPTNPSTPTPPAQKSSDATLKSLGVSGYTLSPSFSSNTDHYTIKVPSSATNVKIEGSANHGKATIAGLGNVNLTGDNTTATVTVTAEDGSKKTYTINIEKEKQNEPAKDGDATLKSLNISGYTLKPGFNSNTNTYSMTVKNNVTGLNVDAIANSSKSRVEVSGNGNWKVGVNVITIKVTAENGNVNTYTVNVTREAAKANNTSTPKPKSSDNYLKDLIINSSHEISPKFNKNTSNYSVTVPYEVDKLDLTYVTNNSNAKVKVNGNSNFLVGEMNTVEIEVTAEDGTIRVYTLNVTRSTQNGKTDLKELTVSNGTLSPNFDPSVLEYNVKVDGKTDKLDIRAISKDADSKVEIIGNDNLKEGNNTILVKVTDKNGFTKYYTLNVEKAPKKTILGLSPLQFGIISGIIGLLLLLLFFLLWKRRKDDDEEEVKEEPAPPAPVTPIIEVKPEFNFSSKNTSDDDIVHGNMNQDSTVTTGSDAIEATRTIPAIEATYEDVEDRVPYDPYDETVTKKELIDAINEATKTKDPAKLKMLLEQDALNQKKKEIRKKEEELRRKRDTDNWR